MRVITLSRRGIDRPLPTVVEGARGRYLALHHGEVGRGRWQVRIPLAVRDFPPPAEDGDPVPLDVPVGLRVLPKKDKRGNPILLLTRGQEDGRVLVLWYLSPGFRGSARYEIEGAKILAEGYEAQGLAGRAGGAPCPVVLVEGPCRLSWHRTGRLYGSAADWVAEYDGTEWAVSEATACEIETAALEY